MQHILDELKAFEERARKLQNQNLADIAASAYGKVKQLGDHPDLELVNEKKDQAAPFPAESGQAGAPPSGPKAPTPVTGL